LPTAAGVLARVAGAVGAFAVDLDRFVGGLDMLLLTGLDILDCGADFLAGAVSSSGNHDNSIYNRWWSEKHHGVKEMISDKGDTSFLYSIEKNADLAKNLKGHLMLSTGDIDNNVHPGNTIRVVNALIKADKRFELVMLPGQRHAYGESTEYFWWRMADYFSRYLIGDLTERPVAIEEMDREQEQTGAKSDNRRTPDELADDEDDDDGN